MSLEAWGDDGMPDHVTEDQYAEVCAEIDALKQWIADLQSGMYINCVYCGHRYGPADTTPASKSEMLKVHIMACPEHPMSELKAELSNINFTLSQVFRQRDELQAKLTCIRVAVNKQADDDGIWFRAEHATEAYLQQELRKIHSIVESA